MFHRSLELLSNSVKKNTAAKTKKKGTIYHKKDEIHMDKTYFMYFN